MKALGERDSMAVDVGHDQHPHTLQMRVLERSPYTTTVRLEDQELLATLPASRLTVRMYHDARLAEVTEARPFRRVNARYAYPTATCISVTRRCSGTGFWRNGCATSMTTAAIVATPGGSRSRAVERRVVRVRATLLAHNQPALRLIRGEMVTNSCSWTCFLEKCHHLGYK